MYLSLPEDTLGRSLTLGFAVVILSVENAQQTPSVEEPVASQNSSEEVPKPELEEPEAIP